MTDKSLSLPELPTVCSVAALGYLREEFRFRDFLINGRQFGLGIAWTVRNYRAYISCLLAHVFSTRPETHARIVKNFLVEPQPVLEKGMAYLVAEEETNKLFDKGIDELSLYFAEVWGFDLFEEPDTQIRCHRIVEIGNRLLHSATTMRDRLEYEDRFFETIPLLMRSVLDLDLRAKQHFGIPRSEPLSEERLKSETEY